MVKGVATFVPSWAPYGGPKPTIVRRPGGAGQRGHRRRVEPAHQRQARTADDRADDRSARSSAKTRFTWFGGNTSSAVATYDVRFRKARWDGSFGSWTRPASWQGTTVTNTPLGLRAGYDYCVSVRARNRAGQLSGWSGQRCLARALDDKRLSVSSGWKRKSASTFYSGSALSTTSKGATLVRTGAKVKRVGLVATTCRTCGKVAVLVDGKRIGTGEPQLARAGTGGRCSCCPRSSAARHTITLRVLTSGLTVQVDGLVLSRT